MRRWWVLAALGTALLLVGSGQTWATGTTVDPVLGSTRIQATGAQAGSTLTAGALLAGAALLAGLVGTRPVRLAAALCLAGGGVLAGLPVIRTLVDPGAVAEAVAADRPGAGGLTLQIEDAGATLWPWLGALGAVLVLLGAILCALLWFRPPQPAATGAASEPDPAGGVPGPTDPGPTDPGSTDPAPSAASGAPAPGPAQRRGQRSSDAWDDLSRGDDPTVDD
ncbi:Trp biosynthesis-associated membrane protein [Ornithinimicrobium cryptoxanthini]|uniref:Trp biosynthesis-associated membrane protein n=1 Tax=Ornithinimicrobium cryptoxanthini TaxID=2934161 RepID=A0ABY4YE82_9MICO|nr:Trp biosynthesis-associated membrane protein [Ornithinimicrobium cryptoxanthini]USQ74954.1 Trp biosynthesis-associated membrane protein [Ornithinimicrobium cryptoxanthini]